MPRSPTRNTPFTSTPRPRTGERKRCAKRSRPGKHIYCEKPIADTVDVAYELYRLAAKAGVKHGVVQDKLWLPGMLKLKTLRELGFFGKILSVRGEFGYWVFEGDTVPAQRPSWNYRKEDGGGMIIDMLCHWRYVLDNLFGEVKAVSCLGATHVPTRWDEAGKPYDCTADDSAYATFELEGGVIAHFNSSWCVRVRRDDLLTMQVDGTKGSAVAGLRDCWIQPYARDAKAGVESGYPQSDQLFRRLAKGAGAGYVRQRVQSPMGVVLAPRGEGRAVPVGFARSASRACNWRKKALKAGKSAPGWMCLRLRDHSRLSVWCGSRICGTSPDKTVRHST